MSENIYPPNPCEDFELLISCANDGELDLEEKRHLDAHLGQCSSCRALTQRFAKVDIWVAAMVDQVSQPTVAMPKPEKQSISHPANSSRSIRFKRNSLSIAALTAAVMAGALIVFWDWQAVQPENSMDIVGPIVSLSEINSQRIYDQEMMRESMEYDLRALKLQLLASGKSTDADTSNKMLLRINELMGKIEQAKVIN